MRDVLQLKPEFKERVWGGRRLNPQADRPIGEAWVIFEGCQVSGGAWDGMSLAEVGQQDGVGLLGPDVVAQTGNRFPLLVKLLHSTDWLSVQVHPDDEQAAQLEGPGQFGKTEAWHIIEADDDAQVVYGLRGNWSRADLERMIQLGRFEQALNFRRVASGDTLFTPAGCVHAIGPGLFIYEVQQTSDITYRLFDWNRPASAGRELHLAKGLSVLGACDGGSTPLVATGARDVETLTGCEYFVLDHISSDGSRVLCDTGGRSFHALTVIQGDVLLRTNGTETSLKELDSIVVPAGCGEYALQSGAPFRVLCSRAP